MIRLLLCIALSLTGAAAQTARPAVPKKPGSVAGWLTNAVSGSAIRNATVILQNGGGRFRYVTRTDEKGGFLFPSVEAAEGYEASANAQGYTMPTRTRQWLKDAPPFSVGEEQHVKDVAVKLLPLGAIGGRVLDEDGEPVRGVAVQALQYRYVPGGKRLDIAAVATTDDRGAYRIHGLTPGRYLLHAFLRTEAPTAPGPAEHIHSTVAAEGFPPAYYPNGTEPAQAAPVLIQPAADLSGLDFRFTRVPVYHLRGRVIDAPGKSSEDLQMAPCSLGSVDLSTAFSAPIKPDGAFDIAAVAPGLYCLGAGRFRSRYFADATIVAVKDRDVDGVTLTSLADVKMPGTIRIEGEPIDKAGKPRIMLSDPQLPGLIVSSATPEADGSFMVRATPGQFLLQVLDLPEGMYLQSFRMGNDDSPAFRITPAGGKLEIVLGADAGQIAGSVQDSSGNPGDHSFVVLLPHGPRAGRVDLIQTVSTTADGSFKLPKVAPGDYQLFAFETFDETGLRSPELLKLFESRATNVTVYGKTAATARVKTFPAQDVEDAIWRVK